jgi:hypothetical protein
MTCVNHPGNDNIVLQNVALATKVTAISSAPQYWEKNIRGNLSRLAEIDFGIVTNV